MKIRDVLEVHNGLMLLSGGQGSPAKLGKFTYGVVKNIRLLEQQVVNDFRKTQEKIIKEHSLDVPLKDAASEEERKDFESRVDTVNEILEGVLDSEVEDLKIHKLSSAILDADFDTLTVRVANAIFPLIEEPKEESTPEMEVEQLR